MMIRTILRYRTVQAKDPRRMTLQKPKKIREFYSIEKKITKGHLCPTEALHLWQQLDRKTSSDSYTQQYSHLWLVYCLPI
jgi:hypothetical protein